MNHALAGKLVGDPLVYTDGSVILATRNGSKPGNLNYAAYDTQGNLLKSWVADSPYFSAKSFVDRGRQWLELRTYKTKSVNILHSLTEPDRVLEDFQCKQMARLLGDDRYGRLVILQPGYVAGKGNQLEARKLSNLNVVDQNINLSATAGESIAEAILSPDKTRLAYTVFAGGKDRLPSWIARRLPLAIRPRQAFVISLWTCNLDGTHSVKLGCINAPVERFWPTSLTWLRDSKSVSFAGGNCIYVVSAP